MKTIYKKLAYLFLFVTLFQSSATFDIKLKQGRWDLNLVSVTQAQVQTNQLFYSDSDVPIILPRSTWDNSPSLNSLLTWLPQNTTFPSDWQSVERFIIHDTGCDISNATCNNNTDPVATIQAIYRFHAVSRGWGDIGYNYIIDQQGRIYEGRFGGNGSRGAHTFYDRLADNYNYGSIGIALLGNYGSQAVPQIMYDSLERLIGWLAAANNLDPQGTKSSNIWNLSKGGFVTPYTGPVVVGHKDIEPGNPDPAMLDLVTVRQQAAKFRTEFQALVYGAPSGSLVYQLTNGSRKEFQTINDLTAQGITYNKLATISQTQLDLFSESRFFKYADGSLLQANGTPMVFLIDSGKKRSLTVSSQQFSKLGFSWDNIRKIMSLSDLDAYPNGPDVIYGPDKELLKGPDGLVYLIENGKKRWITSDTLLKTLGYKWNKVKNKTADFVASILSGDNMSYPSLTLVKGSGATVYLIDKGQKREFLSGQSFAKLGYQWKKVLTISDDELVHYPSGNFMAYKDGTLVQAAGDPSVYLISSGQKRAFVSAEQFANLGNKWSNILSVSSDELSHYLSAGNVMYPDGTLIQKNGETNVYRIVGGVPTLIPDLATFKKLKLSWSKVLKISPADFVALYGGFFPSPSPSASPIVPANPVPQPPSPSATSTPQVQPPPTGNQSVPVPSSVGPNIRVAIWNVPASQSEVVFGANGPYDVYDKNGSLVASKQSADQFSVNTANPSSAFAKIVPKSGSILEIVSYTDMAWNKITNYNKFRGNLELVYSAKSGKLWVVNELPLEEYLKGVAETSQGLAMEYLKTMAVAARTYAYHYQQLGGKYGSDEVYHITNTTSDQLYKGYGREQFASDIVTAAQATAGEIVVYNGHPIVTAYSSGAPELLTSGSKSACSVWGGKYCQPGFEYLNGGVKDPPGTTYSYEACGGGNHCVGLSGAGTRQLAAIGKTYKEILTYYYPGTTINKIY